MLTLEEFEEILEHINKNDKDNETLTKILVSDDCTGFTSFGDELVRDVIKLLAKVIKNPYTEKELDWWLYEDVEKIVEYKDKKYNLTEVKDLYYWLKEEYNNVKVLAED